MEYYIMNFDIPVVQFAIGRDEIFNVVEYGKYKILRQDLLPFGFTTVDNWLASRKAPNHRANIEKLLLQCGISDMLEYIDVSMALTLTDAYWVKPISSEISFSTVNIYENNFSDVAAQLAFDGTGTLRRGLNSLSPEISTDGALAKCWIRRNGKISLYKQGSSGASNTGFEPYSEYYACQILEAMGVSDYTKYNIKVYRDKLCSTCGLFTSKSVGFVPADRMGLSLHPGELLREYSRIGCGDIFRHMVIFDGITINDDRHLGNFGFLVDNKTRKILKNAPIFDNGQSLLPFVTEDIYSNIDTYIAQKGPRIGAEFVDIAKNLMTNKDRAMLRRLMQFKLKKHPKHNLTDLRLELLNKVIRYQVQKIIR